MAFGSCAVKVCREYVPQLGTRTDGANGAGSVPCQKPPNGWAQDTNCAYRWTAGTGKTGQGAVTAVLGEPGEGKSRLVQEVAETAAELGFEIQILQGNRSKQHSTLAPVLNQLFRVGAFGSDPTKQQACLEDWLLRLDPELALAAPYFASLVNTNDASNLAATKIPDATTAAALSIFAVQAENRKRQTSIVAFSTTTLWHFDAGEQGPSTHQHSPTINRFNRAKTAFKG